MPVGARACPKGTYLSLDELPADPSLAKLLPLDVAYRFHALPVAEQGGQVTVVMADPEDVEAVAAIAGALRAALCIVQGDAQTIDAHLARVWGRAPGKRVTRLVTAGKVPATEALEAYVRSLAELLGAAVEETRAPSGVLEPAGRPGDQRGDVLLASEDDGSLIDDWLAAGAQPGTMPAALLVASRPRWPLHRILLVLRGEESDAAATDWALRLARPGASAIAVLAVVPPVAALRDGRRAQDRQGLPAVLAGDTSMGQELQEIAHRLAGQGIRGSLRLRQGPAEGQIRRELAEEDPDLVVMALRSGSDRQGLGAALLSWSDRPTLLTRPAPAKS